MIYLNLAPGSASVTVQFSDWSAARLTESDDPQSASSAVTTTSNVWSVNNSSSDDALNILLQLRKQMQTWSNRLYHFSHFMKITLWKWNQLSWTFRAASREVRHKQGCTATYDDYRLEISDFGIRRIVLSMLWKYRHWSGVQWWQNLHLCVSDITELA